MHRISTSEFFHCCARVVLGKNLNDLRFRESIFRMGGSPICIYRPKSTVTPGSHLRADPSSYICDMFESSCRAELDCSAYYVSS